MGATATQTKEYREEDLPAYTPMPWTLQEIRDAIPARLFQKDPVYELTILSRDITLCAAFWYLATFIDPYFKSATAAQLLTPGGAELARWATWGVYWWFQGLVFMGIWVFGHECGHGAFSDSKLLNDVVGFLVHCFTWTPYFSWKISHHRHHVNHGSMERDEVYVPRTRSDLGIPDEKEGYKIDYSEFFHDSPIWTLGELIVQQVIAWPAYLMFNATGQRSYPKFTNHFTPNSILFTKAQRNLVLMSDAGLLVVFYATYLGFQKYGLAEVTKYYLVPVFEVSQWFIMITYLHHTAPYMPHYRNKEWNFQRGAAGTVDRDFLGWQGTFFLHNMAHFHVVHHFFPKMPFFNGPEGTKALKALIGEHYHRSENFSFPELYDTFKKCRFVENDGDVVFYRDKLGHATTRPADAYFTKTIKTD
ncbi:hypothetical protein FISHEDRAFT_44005 [Fistulina hepatica ATCC 64428]|uniref:Fatty acid desaturase domain-containing protein n=1 Tax=Fistulina hepatica ATCC 64428 TaxID=1128425 RepID=A0A0D7AAQ5_9AGAR|nr:hypothetical protein FISHEDRAFT_44005 [Fistulina hepatica ATCC 64428]